MPSNDAELNAIQIQPDLELYQIPLDREFSDGWSTVDPEYSINGFQHRWCSVPVDRDLSGIDCPYEVLAELYIPDDYDTAGNNLTRAAANLPNVFVDELVREAYNICGIELELANAVTRANVTPSGRILAWDDTKRAYVGNKGMKVRAVRGFKTSSGFCDEEGYYQCDKSFTYSWDYHMHFDRADFQICEDYSTSAICYHKNGVKTAWNYTFKEGSIESYWATIFRATHHYYYEQNEIHHPPLNGFWNAILTIRAMHTQSEAGAGNYRRGMGFMFSPRPLITIYRGWSRWPVYPSMIVYATTTHELAHASHWGFSSVYNQADGIVKESYTTGVERHFTRKAYPNRNYEPDYYRASYTGMMRDLCDDYKKVETEYWMEVKKDAVKSIYNYQDRVDGYTIKELEEAVKGCHTWSDWRDKIKSKYPDKQDRKYVDEVFRFWRTETPPNGDTDMKQDDL